MSDPGIARAGAARSFWQWAWVYLACLLAVLGYSQIVGPVAFVGDSFYLCDPAKYFAGRSAPEGARLLFFYRPLISFLWLPAYFFHGPEAIVLAIRGINALIYAAVIWPLLLLLRAYVKLPGRESLLLAFVLALGPCALIYAPMLLTEAIYIPIFLAAVFVVWRRSQGAGLWWDVSCGFLLALCYLSRHAGSIVPVAWAVAEGIRFLWGCDDGKKRWEVLWRGAIVGMVAAVFIGSWMLIEHALKKDSAPTASASLLLELSENHEFALAWAGNLLQYLIWSPAGFIILPGVLVLLASPRVLARDTTALFVLATVFLAIVTTVLFQSAHWGDRSLTLNRYLAPYVAPMAIICWRYSQSCGRGFIIAAASVAGILWILGFPEGLNTHFQDILAWTKWVWSPSPGWKVATHAIFALAMAVGLFFCWRRSATLLICLIGISSLVWDAGAAVFWRNFSARSVQPVLGGATLVWKATQQDGAFLAADEAPWIIPSRESMLFLCFYPEQLPERSIRSALEQKGTRKLRFVTPSRFLSGDALEPSSPIWEFPSGPFPGGGPLVRLEGFPEESLAYLNVARLREQVVLVNDDLLLKLDSAGQGADVELRLKVISPKSQHVLHVDDGSGGVPAPVEIPAGTLKDGWSEIRVPVHLQAGGNSVKLRVEGPATTMGRRSVRLVVSNKIDVRPPGP